MSVRCFVLLLSLCLIGAQSDRTDANDHSLTCSGSPMVCDHGGFVCDPCCEDSCYCHRCCRGCLSNWCKWHWMDSTCDMYPHYAYYPENHGYYYYRPYNWEHYGQDTPRMLGLGYAAPYSEDGFRELKPTAVVQQPVLAPRRKSLPKLEELLQK